jgi:hypothetical protein
MKKSLYITAFMFALAGALTACQDDYEDVADYNHVYGSTTDRVGLVLLDGKANEMTRTFNVTMAQPVDRDVNVTYAVYPEGVDAYNTIYNETAELLPEKYYDFTEPTAVISAGKVTSSDASITFKDMLDIPTEKVHVLPVHIVSADMDVLKSESVKYFVFRGAALINVVGGMSGTCMRFVNEGQCPLLGSLSTMTFEALLYPDGFNNTLSTLIGIEGTFLIRVGDAGIPSNQIQLATSNGNVTDAAWQLEVGKWTFVTLTFDNSTGEVNVYFDGVKKGSTQYSSYSSTVNWNVVSDDRACYIGYAYDVDRYFDGKMSEMRIWNKILSPETLRERNHFYRVDEDADGLVAYWKFDEGGGSTVHDYANGYDMAVPATYPGKSTAPGSITWYSVTMP